MRERNCSFDLLRSLMMMYVVLIHILGYGFLNIFERFSIEWCLINLLNSFIKCAVPVFVMISGYFGIYFSIKKLFKFEFQLLFYSVGIFLAVLIIAQPVLDFLSVARSLLPFSYKNWWFATIYMALMPLAFFLNMLSDAVNKKKHLLLLMICFLLFNVIPSFSLDPVLADNGYGIVNFVFLYMIGRYIRKYAKPDKHMKNKYLFGYIFLSLLIFTSYVLYGNYKFATYNSVLLLITSICFFMYFVNVSIDLPVFSKISPYVFAVYLVHDNFWIRRYIIKQLNINGIAHTAYFVPYIAGVAIAIFFTGISIDYVRQRTLGRLEDRLLDSQGFGRLIEKGMRYLDRWTKEEG